MLLVNYKLETDVFNLSTCAPCQMYEIYLLLGICFILTLFLGDMIATYRIQAERSQSFDPPHFGWSLSRRLLHDKLSERQTMFEHYAEDENSGHCRESKVLSKILVQLMMKRTNI